VPHLEVGALGEGNMEGTEQGEGKWNRRGIEESDREIGRQSD